MKATNRFTYDPSVSYLFVANLERLKVNADTDDRIKIAKEWLQANDISLAEYIDHHQDNYDHFITVILFNGQ